MEKNKEVDEYLQTLTGEGKEWIEFFVSYMRENHGEIEEVISFKMPTYKLGSGKMRNYIAFSLGKNHFSLHTMDFEYIVHLKEKLRKPGKGKGCVNVPYGNFDERKVIIDGIEEIIKRKVLETYGNHRRKGQENE